MTHLVCILQYIPDGIFKLKSLPISMLAVKKKGLTMPLTVAQNKDRRERLVSGGGLKQDTLQRRQKAAEDFDNFIQQSKICGVPLGIIMDY